MAETLLAPTLLSSSPSGGRMEVGTVAISDLSGSCLVRSRYRRRPPPTIASTTSFTVVPKAFLMALTSDRLAIEYATLRWGVMAPLNDVRGAVRGAGGLTVSEERRLRTTLNTACPAFGITDTTCTGRLRRERTA